MDSLFPITDKEITKKNKIKIKKESMHFIYYMLEELYKSNHLFFNITGLNLDYKNIISFLKVEDPSFIDLLTYYERGLFPRSFTNTNVILSFIKLLKTKLIESFRFEVVVFFYEEKTDCFSIDILLCFKSFGFDTISLVNVHLLWLLRSFSLLLSVKHLPEATMIKDLFYTNYSIKEFCLYYNSTFVFNVNKHQRLGFPYFLYFFLRNVFECYNLNCLINPIYEVGKTSLSFPNCSYNSNITKESCDIINTLAFYLILEGCFLDLNTNLFFKKSIKGKSTVVLLGSLSDLKNNYIYILFYLKSYISKKYAYDYEFLDENFPFFPVSFTSLDNESIEMAFKFIEKNFSLLLCIDVLVFDIIEYKNGYYSLRDNFFYSYSFLKDYLPSNEIEINSFISYTYENKIYTKKTIFKHEFMSFLKHNLTNFNNEFFCFLDLIFFTELSTRPVTNSFSILYMDSFMKSVFIKFFKQVYSNHPFIFLNFTKNFSNKDQLKFSKDLPIFVFIEKIDESLISFLYNLTKISFFKPYSIILIIDDLSLDLSILNGLFVYNFINLNTSYFYEFCKIIEKYDFSFDLFIILNHFYLKKNKIKPKRLFLRNYRVKD